MSEPPAAGEHLDPEDVKLILLARAARGRTGASEGAAVRDSDGRTYAAATVALQTLQLSALQAAVVAAVSSGVKRLEAAAVVSGADALDPGGVSSVRELSDTAAVFLAGLDGMLVSIDRAD